MNEFDSKAGEWDSNQRHIDRSIAIAKALMQTIPLENAGKAMEYGAGTALLSFELKDHLHDITLMDSSSEMVRVMQSKINAENISHMHPVLIDLENQPYTGRFDLIYSQMVFHHVGNVDLILDKFYNMLDKDGHIAVADLFTEDGTFHGNGFTGHKGFDPDYLAKQLKNHGYRHVKYKHCYTIHKIMNDNEEKAFPVFLMTAVK